MTKHLIIVGFMGTGKTTLGEMVHRRLNCHWVDTDIYLEMQWGVSISDYLARYGELAFRDEESRVLKDVLCMTSPCVISTGGGMVLREENRRLMLQYGKTVCLSTNLEEIITRVSQNSNRPLLSGDIREKVQSIYNNRRGIYDFADLTIDTSGMLYDSILNEVISFWNSE